MRKVTFIFVSLLALTVTAWAGEPWKQKSYKEWDAVDLKRILFDSPWARQVSVGIDVLPGLANPLGGGASSAGGPKDPGSPNGGTSDVPDVRGGGISFWVQWASSFTIRRATVRSAVRRGALSEADGDKSLTGEVADYGIAIIGGNMLDFQKFKEDGLAKVTYLKAKKGRDKLAPTSVEIQRGSDRKTITGVLFHFPKKMANGEAVIAPDEKSVEFACKLGTITIRTTFEPQKMVLQEGADW